MNFLSFLYAFFHPNAIRASEPAEYSDNKTAVLHEGVGASPLLTEKTAYYKVPTPEASQSEHDSLLSRSHASYSPPQSPPQINIQEPDVTAEELEKVERFVDTWKEFSIILFIHSIPAILFVIKPLAAEIKGSVKYCMDALMLAAVLGCVASTYMVIRYSNPDKQKLLARSLRTSDFALFIAHTPFIAAALAVTGLTFEVFVCFFPAAINYFIVLFIVVYALGFLLLWIGSAVNAREERNALALGGEPV